MSNNTVKILFQFADGTTHQLAEVEEFKHYQDLRDNKLISKIVWTTEYSNVEAVRTPNPTAAIQVGQYRVEY